MRRTTLRALLAFAVLGAALAAPAAAPAVPTAETTYVTMPDGVKIAVSVTYPSGYNPTDPTDNPADSSGWPTLFQMDGYGGGGDNFLGTIDTRFAGRYVIVYASIRGTGCSGGRFDLFDRAHAEDGETIIDTWIPDQPWSNGKVGIIGHSYPGLTGWMVASTRPANLDVIAISGLIDDLYRGIVYPGGVPNYGFPALWTGILRPTFELQGNNDRYLSETVEFAMDPDLDDPTCLRHIAERAADQNTVLGVFDNPIVQGATSLEDDTWYQVRSTIHYINEIDKPIHLTQQYQDEQTGPRGANRLFELLSVPKRLVLTNGVHATTAIANADRLKWLDCWTYGGGSTSSSWCGDGILDTSQRVRLHFEQQSNAAPTNSAYTSGDWPLPETDWTRYYLHDDGSLSTTAGTGEDTRSYVSLPEGRQATEETAVAGAPSGDDGIGRVTFVDGPDQLAYEIEFDDATAIAGPINLTLTASSTAPNTDFFVDLLDVAPDGTVTYLQRGMQRASHRQVDLSRSDFVESPNPAAGTLYRAHHPHTNTTLNVLTPAEPAQLEIEIFPVGHVFRADHKLRVQIHAPPVKDPLSVYAWVSAQPPAVNTVYHSTVNGLEPSSILLPVMPSLPPIASGAPACTALVGEICFKPIA